MKSVVGYLRLSAERFPNKRAFTDAKESLTFAELDAQSRLLASDIIASIGQGSPRPVAVYLPKRVSCIVSFIATAYSGNFYSPLDVSMPNSRLEKIMSTLEPAVVITDSAHAKVLHDMAGPYKLINVDTMRDAEFTINDEAINRIQRKAIDTDPLYVMFTSGSTGMPKGVVISHRAVIDYTEWLAETFEFSDHTIFGNQAPFYFDNSILDIYSTLKNGCETILIPEGKFLSPKNLSVYLEESSVNTIFWVPSALCLIANSGILEELPPRSLEKILFCGEVMPTKQLNVWRRAMPHAIYVNLYGPTEITDVCAYYIVDREFRDDETLPIGYPCNNTDILVLDENGELVSGEDVGELCVRGTCLSSGYYRNEDKTAASFVQNPLQQMYPEKIYRTGDLVRYNQRGELMYLGRKDFQIKHMGHRIELGELETAAFSYLQTEMCCALYDGERKHIILIVSPEDIDTVVLYRHLKMHLPRYMLPERIEVFETLPLNANGKIDRVALLEHIVK